MPFSAEELASVPTGKPLSLLAEIRWLDAQRRGAQGRSARLEAVVRRPLLRQAARRRDGPEERELTDMTRFRPFWNKVWESPTLDAADGGPRKLLWELDANLKYTRADRAGRSGSNGVMETRFLVAEHGRRGGRGRGPRAG